MTVGRPRVWKLLLVTALASACSSSKPTAEQYAELRAWSLRFTGNANFFEGNAKSLTKDDVKCITKSTWKNVTACPVFTRLDLSQLPFDEVHCSKLTTKEGMAKSICDRSWFICDQKRNENRRIQFGLKVDECTVADVSWELTYACNGSETCGMYFSNVDECQGTRALLTKQSNLTECRKRPPVSCLPADFMR